MAAKFQDLYAQPLGPRSDLKFAWATSVEQAISFLATAPPSTEPNLSHVGFMEHVVLKSYGGVEVQNVAFAVQTLAPQVCVQPWSWMGRRGSVSVI